MADEEKEVEQADNAEAAVEGAAEAKPAKSNMLLFIILAAVVVIVTPLSTFLVIKNMAPEPVVKVEQKIADSGEQAIVDMEAIIVNIAETKGTRILRLEPHLVVSEARLADELKTKAKPLLADRVILAASRKTIDDLEGAKGRESLKREIISEINAAIKGKFAGSVVDVYFSEFLIQ